MRDTRTLLPAAPTPSAPAALLPRPQEGAGSVRGDTWWEAVSGVEPAGNRIRLFSGISPCTGPWGYRHGGWGRRGGGTRSPSPVSNAPEIPHISPAPPMPSAAGYPYTSAGTPHPARACGAPPPPHPGGGVGACDIRRAAVPGVEPYLILLPSIPVHRIVVDIGIGGGGRETGPHPRGEHGPCAFPMPAASNPRRKIVTKNVVIFSERASPPSRRRGALPPSPSSAMS